MARELTGYSCPICKRQTGETNEVAADSNRLVCTKVETHVWTDVDDFMNLNPRIEFSHKPPAPAPQQNYTSLNVSLPVNTANVLLSRYGDKRDATISGFIQMLAEGDPLVLSQTDVERIIQVLPEKPKNGSHLIGMCFAMKTATDEAKQDAENARKDVAAYRGMSPGRVILNLDGDYDSARIRAEGENLPVEVWLERAVKNALANNWF